MGRLRFSKVLLLLMLALVLALAACGDKDKEDGKKEEPGKDTEQNEDGNDDDKGEDNEDGLYSIDDFNKAKENIGEAIEGGSLTFGLVSPAPFAGVFNWNFYQGAPDAEVLNWFDEPLLSMNEKYEYGQDGVATWEVEDDRVFTFTIQDGVKWHDGEPLTAEDWAFAFEVIGHADYDGIRYGSDFTNIEGMIEYHAGEADSISGVKVVSDNVLEVTYIEPNPSLLTGGLWAYALAKHIFGDMDVADISSSPELRENPVGIGPFMVDSVVEGESVVYKKFEDYWRGEPNLDEVVLKVINPDVVVQSLETGEVDLVNEFPAAQFVDNADMENVEFLADIDLYYAYVGFKLGNWDWDAEEVNMDLDNSKVSDVNLRTAMAHAIDLEEIGVKLYHGLRWGATTLIPPSHPEYRDEDNEGHPYDVELANEILDDAGYEWADGADFRTDPEGNDLTLNFAAMESDATGEALVKFYIQSWEEIGINVELLEGKFHDFNSFYARVGNLSPDTQDDPEVDVYAGAWGVGSDVDPRGLYGPGEMFNFSRYSSDENDELLAKGVSPEAFDKEYRTDVYKEWQEFMVKEVPVFPTLYALEIVPVNNRVHNYSMDAANPVYRYELAVTQEEPIKAN